MKTKDELIREAKARGAVIVSDDDQGSGFDDNPTEGNIACVGDRETGYAAFQQSYDDQAVIDAEKRAQDAQAHIPAGLQEAVTAMREENTDAVRAYRYRFQEEYTGWVPGQIMWLGDFLQKLQTLRPDTFFAEVSYMGLRGIGFVGPHDVKQEDGTVRIESGPYYSGVSYHNGNAPEWTQVRLDIHNLPTGEKYRGWRAVLLSLVRKGIITEQQCDDVFGKPSGPRSKSWYRSLWEMRNGKCGECRKDVCDCMDKFDYIRSDNYAYPVPEGVQKGQRQEVEPREERRIIGTW